MKSLRVSFSETHSTSTDDPYVFFKLRAFADTNKKWINSGNRCQMLIDFQDMGVVIFHLNCLILHRSNFSENFSELQRKEPTVSSRHDF